MTKSEFLEKLCYLCSIEAGFFTTDTQAKELRSMWPTVAQRNSNPLRIRKWGSFKVVDGCAQFPGPELSDWFDVSYAADQCVEGTKSALRLLERNVFDRRLSLRTLFEGQGVMPGAFPGLQIDGNPIQAAERVLECLHVQGSIDEHLSVLFERL